MYTIMVPHVFLYTIMVPQCIYVHNNGTTRVFMYIIMVPRVFMYTIMVSHVYFCIQ